MSTGLEELEGTARRATVLVVEPDAAVRESLREVLSAHFDVRTSSGGAEAVERARAALPELILMQARMPRVDGIAALEQLRRDARTEAIPVILMAPPDEAFSVRCFEAGAADVVSTPVRGKEVLARVARSLKEHRERGVLEAAAQTDALTGLPNYRALILRIEHEFQRAQRYGHALAVVTIDLDHLKELNDRFGHEVGNQAIVALGGYLQLNLRGADFAARFGGDEFVVILPHQTPHEALVFAERIRHGVKALRLDGSERGLGFTVSAGVAGHWPAARKRGAEALMRASDRALYEAKRRGRDRVVVYERDLLDGDEAEHHV